MPVCHRENNDLRKRNNLLKSGESLNTLYKDKDKDGSDNKPSDRAASKFKGQRILVR